jgi:hypothetical protein
MKEFMQHMQLDDAESNWVFEATARSDSAMYTNARLLRADNSMLFSGDGSIASGDSTNGTMSWWK